MGLNRFIARDEGYYLLAAKLVSAGKVPYLDFFYPQLPLLPYIYAGWFSLFGTTWFSGRIFASLLTLGVAVMLSGFAEKEYGRDARYLTLLTCAACVQLVVWFPTAQVYSLATFLLIASVLACEFDKRFFLAGFLLGCSIATRLTYVPLILLFLVKLAVDQRSKSPWRAVALFGAGALVPLTVVASIATVGPLRFWENIFAYHLERTGHTADELEFRRNLVLSSLFGFRNGAGVGSFQFLLLSISAIGTLIISQKRKQSSDFLVLIGIALFIIHLTPSPTYLQYFSTTAALFIPAAVGFWKEIVSPLRRIRFRGHAIDKIAVAAILVAFAIPLPGTIEQFTRSGERVIGVGPENRMAWTIGEVSHVTSLLNQATKPGEVIYASWAGYLVESHGVSFPGTENHFASTWATRQKFTPEEQIRRRVTTRDKVIDAFRSGQIGAAVLFVGLGRKSDFEKKLHESGGTQIVSRQGVSIYKAATTSSLAP